MTWTYAPAPETAALANLQPAYRPFIGGEFVDGGGEALKTVNPATEEVLAEVGTASTDDMTGRSPPPVGRTRRRGAHAGAERAKYVAGSRGSSPSARELAVLETLDNGKPIRESREWTCPPRRRTCSTTRAGPTSSSYAGLGPAPRPLGVVGAVIPWNFPLLMAAWKSRRRSRRATRSC